MNCGRYLCAHSRRLTRSEGSSGQEHHLQSAFPREPDRFCIARRSNIPHDSGRFREGGRPANNKETTTNGNRSSDERLSGHSLHSSLLNDTSVHTMFRFLFFFFYQLTHVCTENNTFADLLYSFGAKSSSRACRLNIIGRRTKTR